MKDSIINREQRITLFEEILKDIPTKSYIHQIINDQYKIIDNSLLKSKEDLINNYKKITDQKADTAWVYHQLSFKQDADNVRELIRIDKEINIEKIQNI